MKYCLPGVGIHFTVNAGQFFWFTLSFVCSDVKKECHRRDLLTHEIRRSDTRKHDFLLDKENTVGDTLSIINITMYTSHSISPNICSSVSLREWTTRKFYRTRALCRSPKRWQVCCTFADNDYHQEFIVFGTVMYIPQLLLKF